MQRKVAYVFLYKNGIRERSVGIVRRYGTAEQPEVALELFEKELQRKRWDIFYFTKDGALAGATYLWGSTRERGTSEARIAQCRLCTEAGTGEGIVLLPATANCADKQPEKATQQKCSGDAPVLPRQEKPADERAFREFLCARYDGGEVTAEDLRKAFRRKTEGENGGNPCVESAKRLMEEIARAAGGETSVGGDSSAGQKEASFVEKRQELPLHRKPKSALMKNLENLIRTNPAYLPCRKEWIDYSVRITPEDLSCLPKENKGYMENNYLLHGYYRYRHVLLGRQTGKKKVEYVLMVPGIYSRKEAGLAKLFGFPEFLPVIKTKPETGSAASGRELFGYFCGKI